MFGVLSLAPVWACGQIESATRLTLHPSRYGRVDFVAMLQADWATSAYRSEEVQLDLELVAPSGARLVVPSYYEKGASGGLSVWRARFAPVEVGNYSGSFVLQNGGKRAESARLTFAVAPSDRKGFLRLTNGWTLRFDNGEPFRGIGENVAWESRSRDDSRFFRDLHESPRYNYEYMLGNLAAHGGNFFRTWMCPWNLPLEWKKVGNTNRYADDERGFNASAMQRMDQLVELIEALDLRMMLTLNNSADFQGGAWKRSSYNIENGGPAATPLEFFTNPQARAQYKNRLRYLVARWGHSPHIAAWEFFNEVDNLMYGLPQRIPDDAVTGWHKEMSEYLKSIDPYHHLVTTSISHREIAGLDRVPAMDFNQHHIYGHEGKSHTSGFGEVLRHDIANGGKPYVIGEFGFEWDWGKNFDECASGMDADFKEGLWLGLFSPTPILPMSWWWEYFDHRGLTPYFARVRSVLDQMLAAGNGEFADVKCAWSGASGHALAVRCGKTFFVLLANDGKAPVSGSVSLPLESSCSYQVRAYDAGQDAACAMPFVPVGGKNVAGITVAPADQLILTVSP